MTDKTALVLSGGGARGAYQVGVLKGFSEILKDADIEPPFKILSGTSAGAINTAKLACTDLDFHSAVKELIHLWSNIDTDQVFKTELINFGKFGLGSLLGSTKKFNSLLDTAPLKKLIEDNCDFGNITKNLANDLYESVIVTANNYSRNVAVSFIQTAHRDHEKLIWKESRRQAEKVNIKADHILASAAIPMLFPPVHIHDEPYGDGCVRNSTPCSPSIRMGANKLFVIGVRSVKPETPMAPKNIHDASMVRILNTLLNAVLLDSVEQDVIRIQRINQLHDEAKESNPSFKAKNLKKIPALCISPSKDIGLLAREKAHHIPRILRMTLSAFGDLDEATEIISYLLFDGDFCKSLIQMGYEDSLNQKKEILAFLNDHSEL